MTVEPRQEISGNDEEKLPDAETTELNVEDGDESEPSVEAAALVEPTLEIAEFAEADLAPELIETIRSAGWLKPTRIQSLCLPHTLKGRDVAGFAQTGTGKTGVFLITMAHRLLTRRLDPDYTSPFAIVLSPTRELAMQIEADARALLEPLRITTMAVFGGVDYEKQASQLSGGVDVVVATPGRLKDYLGKRIFDISKCEIFVCDEADRMFDMGFIDDVRFFLDKLSETCQRLLFSATTSESVQELAFEYLDKPQYVSATPESITPENIDQRAYIVESRNKLKLMMGLLRDHKPVCSIIFTNTKVAAEWLHFKLNNNEIQADLITGDLPQRKRINLIKRIKAGEVKALIATDVASRGLHIPGVTHVYNFDLPDESSNYVHRIGRTARAGAEGMAVSLVCEDYGANLRGINDLLGAAAMKAQWYENSYEDIVDKAGNPFPSGHKKNQDRGGGRSSGGRSDHRGPRRPSNQDRGRSGPPQRGQPNRDRNRDQNRQQGRGQRHDNRGRPHQHEQRPRGNFDQQRRPPTAPTTPVAAKTTNPGFVGLVKKFFSSILGDK